MNKDSDFQATDEGQGLLLAAFDGRIFFVPEGELAKFEVRPDATLPHQRVVSFARERLAPGAGGPITGGPIAHPMASCAWMLHWLCTHDPNNKVWRQNSVVWMNAC